MKEHQTLVRRVSALFFVVMLVACVSAVGMAKDKLIVLWPTYTQEKIDFGQYLVDSFQEKHPELEVQLLLEYSKLPVLIAAGSPPDVTWQGAAGYSNAAQGWFLDLSPYVARDESELAVRDFFPALWEHTQIGSMRWGMPLSVNLGIYYYNQDLFDRRGVAYPRDSWVSSDFVNAARRLTYDTNGDNEPDIYGASLELTNPTWFYAYGGPVINPEGTKSIFINPAREKALEFYNDIRNTWGVEPPKAVLQRYARSNASPIMFLNEHLAITFGGIAGTLGTIRSAAEFNWDVAAWPWVEAEGKLYRGTTYTPESLAIPYGAANPDAAWEFIKHAMSVQVMAEVTRRGHIFPTRQRVLASDAWSSPQMPPRNQQAFIDSLAMALPHIGSIHVMGSDMNTSTNALLTTYLGGTVSLRETMERIDQTIQMLLDEYNR
ncbi:MAG: extracellular solute-binding protein [Limnochordia bacterium]|jgi:multiple sugar transport system substrate-binding protein